MGGHCSNNGRERFYSWVDLFGRLAKRERTVSNVDGYSERMGWIDSVARSKSQSAESIAASIVHECCEGLCTLSKRQKGPMLCPTRRRAPARPRCRLYQIATLIAVSNDPPVDI